MRAADDSIFIRNAVIGALLALNIFLVFFVSHAFAEDSAAQGEIISLDLQDADLKETLRWLAERMNKNIVIDEDVSGTLTLVLRDVPVERVFKVILRTKDLIGEEQGNVIIVRPLLKAIK